VPFLLLLRIALTLNNNGRRKLNQNVGSELPHVDIDASETWAGRYEQAVHNTAMPAF
jgi:hypothetical protein